MASFRDQVLLELSTPATFGALLLDTDRRLVRTMLAATYDLAAVRIDQVRDVVVRELDLQYPLFARERTVGNWTQLTPSYIRTEVALEQGRSHCPVWMDILARLRVTVVTEIDPAGVESVTVGAADDFATLDEFRQRFPFIDLDRIMAEHGISTVAELRAAFQHVLATVRLRAAGPFDPDDPANTHTLDVTVATVAVDPFDIAEGLRAARLITEVSRGSTGATPSAIPLECTASYAPAVVFAAGGPENSGTTADAVEQLCAGAGVAALFLSTTQA